MALKLSTSTKKISKLEEESNSSDIKNKFLSISVKESSKMEQEKNPSEEIVSKVDEDQSKERKRIKIKIHKGSILPSEPGNRNTKDFVSTSKDNKEKLKDA